MKAVRSVIITLLLLILVAVLVAGGLVGFLMVTEYRPDPAESLTISRIHDSTNSRVHDSTSARIHEFTNSRVHEFRCLTWNIGYAGLGKEMDFFYDGGRSVRSTREQSERYLAGISKVLAGFDSLDFIFLQEVDLESKRSYRVNEAEVIRQVFPDHESVVALNYDCRLVPVPVTEPMGKVKSGIVAFSRRHMENATRYRYEATFSWPKRLAFLKRCFQASRFRMDNGKELVMVNLHNSTFDDNGALRLSEMAQLEQFLEAEYSKGNYVVAGGDWNMNPRGFHAGGISTGDRVFDITPPIGNDFLPRWQFAFDQAAPSNRNVDEPYAKGRTGTTIIDFFVVSPNIGIVETRTFHEGFEYSDHNPVLLTFRLK